MVNLDISWRKNLIKNILISSLLDQNFWYATEGTAKIRKNCCWFLLGDANNFLYESLKISSTKMHCKQIDERIGIPDEYYEPMIAFDDERRKDNLIFNLLSVDGKSSTMDEKNMHVIVFSGNSAKFEFYDYSLSGRWIVLKDLRGLKSMINSLLRTCSI